MLVEGCPALVKNNVAVADAEMGLAGIPTEKRGEEVAPPRGVVAGVARKSAATADSMSVAVVCSTAV